MEDVPLANKCSFFQQLGLIHADLKPENIVSASLSAQTVLGLNANIVSFIW